MHFTEIFSVTPKMIDRMQSLSVVLLFCFDLFFPCGGSLEPVLGPYAVPIHRHTIH